MVKNLRILTALVALMVAIDALIIPAVLIWAQVDGDSLVNIAGADGSGIDTVSLGFKVLTMIVFAIWIYVAGKNLEEAELDLEFTPGSRIWWFVVPIACLFKPFQGMREMWNASHGVEHYDDNDGLVTTWWCLWLGGSFAASFTSFAAGQDSGVGWLWVQSGINIAQATAAILLTRGIARAQRGLLSGERLDEVFA